MSTPGYISDKLFPAATDNFQLHKLNYTTSDIIKLICEGHKKSLNDTLILAGHIPGKSVPDYTRNLFNLVKQNIAYKLDPEGAQFVKSPSQVWKDRFADCKSYSLFIATTLHNAGIPYKYRFVSYTTSRIPTHVYVIVPVNSSYITMDAVMPEYNKEKKYKNKKDIDMKGLYYVSGIGIIARKPIPTKFDLMKKDITKLTKGEMDLLIARDQLLARKAVVQNMRGVGALQAEQYQDKIDVIEDALGAMDDYKTGRSGNLMGEIVDISFDAISGNYDIARKVYGIGEIGAKKAVRQAAKKQRQEKRQEIKKTTKGKEKREALRKLTATEGTKTGKFLLKAAKATKKGFKAVAKVATAPQRLAVKGILEITLPKASPFFLYLFINDPKLIAKLPAKVRDKRKKSERIANFIVEVIGMKREHFMGITRNGIIKHFGKTPEQVIAAQMKGKLAGIGEGLIGTIIDALVKLIGIIAKAFKKKSAEKITADDAPDTTDWDEINQPVAYQQEQQKEAQQNLAILSKTTGKNKRLQKKVEKLQAQAAKNPKKAKALTRVNAKLEKLNKSGSKVNTGINMPKVEKILDTMSDLLEKPEPTKKVDSDVLANEIKNQEETGNFEAGGKSIWNSLNL